MAKGPNAHYVVVKYSYFGFFFFWKSVTCRRFAFVSSYSSSLWWGNWSRAEPIFRHLSLLSRLSPPARSPFRKNWWLRTTLLKCSWILAFIRPCLHLRSSLSRFYYGSFIFYFSWTVMLTSRVELYVCYLYRGPGEALALYDVTKESYLYTGCSFQCFQAWISFKTSIKHATFFLILELRDVFFLFFFVFSIFLIFLEILSQHTPCID